LLGGLGVPDNMLGCKGTLHRKTGKQSNPVSFVSGNLQRRCCVIINFEPLILSTETGVSDS